MHFCFLYYWDYTERILEMAMSQFRQNIAKELCVSTEKKNVGHPSSTSLTTSNSNIEVRAVHPVESIRYDNTNHFPEWGSKKACRFYKKSDTHTVCTKCNLNLCFSKAKNFSMAVV